MTNTMRTFRGVMALALLPVLAMAQAKAPAKAQAPTKKVDTTAMKHDMSKMNKAGAESKQGMGGMKMDPAMQAKMAEKMKDTAMKQKMAGMMKDSAMKQKMAGMQHDMGAMKAGEKAGEKMGEMKHDMAGMAGMAGMSGGMKEEMSGWKELDAFHAMLQMTWHPVGTGDFKPAREHGAHLLDAALAWRQSKGPAACDNESFRKGMPDLIAEARSFADAVKRSSSDDAVKVTLKRTHDAFEAIAEPCMMAGMKGMKMDAPKKP